MSQLAVVQSSNGEIYINYHTGEVKHIDIREGGSLPNISKFDIPEDDKCSEYDILDIGFWLDNGHYVSSRSHCLSLFPIAPDDGECVGPFYIKVLKSGAIRFIESTPKGKHIIEYIERIDHYGQDKMHYLTLMNAKHEPMCKCDVRTVCGYDRGLRMNVLLRRMWNGQKRICSARS